MQTKFVPPELSSAPIRQLSRKTYWTSRYLFLGRTPRCVFRDTLDLHASYSSAPRRLRAGNVSLLNDTQVEGYHSVYEDGNRYQPLIFKSENEWGLSRDSAPSRRRATFPGKLLIERNYRASPGGGIGIGESTKRGWIILLVLMLVGGFFVSSERGRAEPLSEGLSGTTTGDDCIHPGNWPMLGGNEGNLNAACREGPADGAARYSVGFQGAGGAVLSIGHLLILTTSSVWGGTNAVHALDSSDGTVVWTRSFESHPFPTASGRGLLFVGTFEGTLFALHPSTGNIVWTFSTGAPGDDWIVPIYADGIVLGASFDGYLHAIDANNGQELWRFRPGTAHYPSVGLGMVFLAVK